MEPINRGTGVTRSERVLAKLADKTFLDLWSYPNTYNDRDKGKGQGKELCDLLAVCGNDVLIFSDKVIDWPLCEDPHLAWKRWFKRAVSHSVSQIRGAERWLRLYPDRVFIDPECKKRLPIDLPAGDAMRVHGVAVATGAREACAAILQDPDGSLMISGAVRGDMHLDTAAEDFLPFTIGDVDPAGSFIHVFDNAALAVVMREMDTLADFVAYLDAREDAIRNGRVGIAASESELVAAYLLCDPRDGKRYIPGGEQFGGQVGDPLHFVPGGYQQLKNHPQYRAKQREDRLAVAWDRLIRVFTEHILGGTSVAFAGYEPDASLSERALRIMAREDRTSRRALGYAFTSALREAEKRAQDRFARVILPFEGCADPECAYIFIVMAFRGQWLTEQGYDYYREGRAGYLKAYGEVVLLQFKNLKRVVGIAVDASRRVTGRRGGSEDLMLLEAPDWTPEMVKKVEELRQNVGILLPERVEPRSMHIEEYPDPDPNSPRVRNRKARRAEAAKSRRGRAGH